MKIIRTILGDIAPAELGTFNYHEHAFQRSPLLPNDDLDSFEKSLQEFSDLKISGFNGYLEATPFGLGRRPELVAKLSQVTGLKIVHTTGFHKLEHYRDQAQVANLKTEQKIALITKEITKGFDDTDFRAGLVKVGVGEGSFNEFEQSSLLAAGFASKEFDVAIMVHLDQNSDAIGVLDFFENQGVNLGRVLLAHADANTDLEKLKTLLSRGAFLGFDRAVRVDGSKQEENLTLFSNLVAAGFASQLLFGGDLARSSRYLAYGGKPGLRFLAEEYLPKLNSVAGEAAMQKVLKENPVTWLAFTPREIRV